MLRPAGAAGEECSVELVQKKTESGVEWVAVQSVAEIARRAESNTRSLDCFARDDRGREWDWHSLDFRLC